MRMQPADREICRLQCRCLIRRMNCCYNKKGLFYNLTPSVSIRFVTILDSPQFVVEGSGHRTCLTVFGNDIFLTGVKVVNFRDGRTYGCCAAGAYFFKRIQFFEWNVALFNIHPHVFCKLPQTFVGD